MAFQTIVIILDGADNADVAADLGLAMAAAHNAHVIGLHAEIVSAVPMVAPMEIPDPIAVQALQDMAHTEAAGIERQFRAKAVAGGGSFEWRSFISSGGYTTQPILQTVRSADLIVVVQADPANPSDAHVDMESLLFESGRPVLILPRTAKALVPARRALIAWNGSKEAARATFDALPFLKSADTVEILSIDASENASQPSMTGEDITATLVRHGVKAALSKTASAEKSAPLVIESRLANDDVDLLVLGAYTHSRLWQVFFSGTTKAVLKSMTTPTLLSR